MRMITAFYFLIISVSSACAQSSAKMGFEEHNPVSTLVVSEHKPAKAKYPFIDVHNHQWDMDRNKLSALVSEMNKMNMSVMINLSGGGGQKIKDFTENIKNNQPSRFVVFTNIDFDGIGTQGWTEKAVQRLEEDVRNGAKGLKIYKSL